MRTGKKDYYEILGVSADASDKAIKETMDQIGPLKRQREYDQFVARVPSFPLVDAILAPLLRAGGVMELVRA